MNGIVSVRCFEKIDFMKKAFYDRVDLHNRVHLTESLSGVWMSLYLDFFVTILIAGTSFFIVLTRYVDLNSSENADSYGLMLSWVITLGSVLPMMLFCLAESFKLVSSVQR